MELISCTRPLGFVFCHLVVAAPHSSNKIQRRWESLALEILNAEVGTPDQAWWAGLARPRWDLHPDGDRSIPASVVYLSAGWPCPCRGASGPQSRGASTPTPCDATQRPKPGDFSSNGVWVEQVALCHRAADVSDFVVSRRRIQCLLIRKRQFCFLFNFPGSKNSPQSLSEASHVGRYFCNKAKAFQVHHFHVLLVVWSIIDHKPSWSLLCHFWQQLQVPGKRFLAENCSALNLPPAQTI